MNKRMLIDGVGFLLIALYLIFSSAFTSYFAKIHFILPIGMVPVFIGEILLFFSLLFLCFKLMMTQGFKRWHWIWVIYGLWVIVCTFYGIKDGGLLPFRHAAMFYYPFFALITYSFYNGRIFSNSITSSFLIIFLSVSSVLNFMDGYYWYSYFTLLIVISLHFFKNKKMALVLIGLVFLIHVQELFSGSRSHLVGIAVAIFMVSICFLFYFIDIRMRYRLGIFSGVIIAAVIGMMVTADRNGLKTLITPRETFKMYQEYRSIIDSQKDRFVMAELKVRLYHRDPWKVPEKEEPQIDHSQSTAEAGLISQSSIKDVEIIKISSQDVLPNVTSKEKVKKVVHSNKDVEIIKIDSQNVLPNVTRKEKVKKVVHSNNNLFEPQIEKKVVREKNIKNVAVKEPRQLEKAYNNILFRWFIWEDMCSELLTRRAVFGVGFGRPQRSRSLEILSWGTTEWITDGWIAPHNSFLHIIYRVGIIGVFLIGFIVAVFVHLLKKFILHKSFIGIMLLSVLLYWLVMANFLLILELPYYAILFWSVCGVTFAYAQNLKKGSL